MAHFSTSGMFCSTDSPLETGSVVEYGKNWQFEMHTEKSFGKQDAKELGGEKKKKKVTTTKKKPPKQTARICDRIS